MKVVHFSTQDVGGGAAKASMMLQKAFLNLGVDHTLMVLRKFSDQSTVVAVQQGIFANVISRVSMVLNSGLIYRAYHPWEFWSLGIARDLKVDQSSAVKQADLISLSWVAGFLGVRSIKKLLETGKPVVWTLYDMWTFTGGCHYSQFCEKFESGCSQCHQLGKKSMIDFSHWVWNRKKLLWNTQNLTVVCPSRWLAKCASSSALLHSVDVRVIPTGIDAEVFRPVQITQGRKQFSLPMDKPLVLFLADSGFANERKGGALLKQAMSILQNHMQSSPDLVLVGRNQVPDELAGKFRIHYPGVRSEQELAALYACCDVVAVPSKEDNLPLTVLESMACETPCVAFDIGGMPDVISHLKNGYLAKPFDVDDYAHGVAWALNNGHAKMVGRCCRQTILDGFTIQKEAEAYRMLYEEKIRSHRQNPGGEYQS